MRALNLKLIRGLGRMKAQLDVPGVVEPASAVLISMPVTPDPAGRALPG